MRVNRDSVRMWQAQDGETVKNRSGGVHHGASAVQNLRAMGEDLVHAALPFDRAVNMAVRVAERSGPVEGPGNVVVAFLAGALLELLELVLLPVWLIKNLYDLCAHGIAAAANASAGERDGEAEAAASFSVERMPSFWRQFGDRDATVRTVVRDMFRSK